MGSKISTQQLIEDAADVDMTDESQQPISLVDIKVGEGNRPAKDP
jgi:hypothetical protein